MPEQAQTVVELGQRVKTKYPGDYDDLDDAEVGRRIKLKYPGDYDDFSDAPAPSTPTPPIDNSLKTFGTAALSRINPINWAKGAFDTAASLVNDPVGTLVAAGPIGSVKRAGQAFSEGRYGEVVPRMVAATMPGTGSMLEESLVKANTGRWAEGLGEMTGDMGLALSGRFMPKAATIRTAAAKSAPYAARAVGTSAGGYLGHMTGIPGGTHIGAVAGYAAGKALGGKIMPRASAIPPPLPVTPPLFDEIAQSLGGKKYAHLDPNAQATVRQVAEQSGMPLPRRPVPSAAPVATGPVNRPAPAPAAASGNGAPLRPPLRKPAAPAAQTPVERIKVDPAASTESLLRQSVDLARNGKIPRAELPPEPTVDMPKVQETVRKIPDEAVRKEFAKSAYRAGKEGKAEPAAAGPVYEAVGRGNKSSAFVEMLSDEKLLNRALKWPDATLKSEAQARGIKPPSSATLAEIRTQIKQRLRSK